VTLTRSWLGLIGWLLVAVAAGAVGALATRNAREFYAGLVRPNWAPPGWLFGPVWTVLYLMMGVAAWLVWREQGWKGAAVSVSLFLVQLAVNALWSWLFFVWRRGDLAFADVLVLWCLIAATIIAFWRISAFAAALLVPYFAWVTFASALTFSVWKLNPALLS